MEYLESYDAFIKYTNYCREIIRKRVFTEEDNLYLQTDGDINEVIKNHRLKMIDLKVCHTMRMIEQIVKINENMNFRFNFKEVMKCAILLHDIGRIKQATWSDTYSDNIYKRKNMPFNNHGEEGYYIFLNNDFKVDSHYRPIIGMSILHHLDYKNVLKLNYKYTTNLSKLDIDNILTGNFELNELEWQVASLIVQLVSDVDKTDILYQHLSKDFEMIRDYVYDYSYKSLGEIASYWGGSKKEIIDYNRIDESKYLPSSIKIPLENVDITKLEVPKHYKDMFYENSWLPLSELRIRPDWNFITILWWRIGWFLNQVEFYSTLEVIANTKLLDKIYEAIPDKYKELVFEAFIYAKEVLITNKLEHNKGKIFL